MISLKMTYFKSIQISVKLGKIDIHDKDIKKKSIKKMGSLCSSSRCMPFILSFRNLINRKNCTYIAKATGYY